MDDAMNEKIEKLFDKAFLFTYMAALEEIGFSRDSKLIVHRNPENTSEPYNDEK